MQTYQQMKGSGVAWLGDIPAEWKAIRGKFVYSSRKEPNKNLQEPQRLALTLKGVIERTDGDEIGLNPESLESYQIFEADDLVFKLIDLENKQTSRVGLVPKRGIMSPAYIRLTPKSKASAKYFFYYYYSLYLNYVYNNIAGEGVRASISGKELLEIEVPVPRLETQNKIADFLDAETAKINDLISKQEKLLLLLEEKHRAIITHTLTRGLNPRIELKETNIPWLGKIPANWNINPLYRYVKENHRPNKGMISENVLSLSYGRIIEKNIDNGGLMPESFETYQLVKPGDIILRLTDLQNDHTSLRVGHSNYDGIITSAYVDISSNTYDSNYLYYLLHAYDLLKVFYNLGGGLRQGMKFSDVKRLPAFEISVDEQKQIVRYVKNHKEKTNHLKQKIMDEITLLKERRTSLISYAVTGKIKV